MVNCCDWLFRQLTYLDKMDNKFLRSLHRVNLQSGFRTFAFSIGSRAIWALVKNTYKEKTYLMRSGG